MLWRVKKVPECVPLNECVCLLWFIAADLPAIRSLTSESGIKLEEWTVLTGLLNRGRAFSKHAQGCVDYLPVELPRSTVVSKCNVLPIFSQNICSYLHHKHDMNGNQPKKQPNRTGHLGESYTHSSRSSCKRLSLLEQDFFGVHMMVDDNHAVGAHHQRVCLSVFYLQFFEKHMRL